MFVHPDSHKRIHTGKRLFFPRSLASVRDIVSECTLGIFINWNLQVVSMFNFLNPVYTFFDE